MHSSRMRIGRSLTVCRSLLPGGWCDSQGVCFGGGCSSCGGVLPGGVCASRGGGIPACIEAEPPPPVNRITDTSKNITLATTSLRPVNIYKVMNFVYSIRTHGSISVTVIHSCNWPAARFYIHVVIHSHFSR